MLSPNHPRCSNCGVTDSPLWRRDPEGNTVCNACGELFSSTQSHNPLCFAIGPLFGVGLDTCLPDATVNLLISFPFSLYSTIKEGAVHLAIFSWFLALQCPKVACLSPGLFPIWINCLQCPIHAHSSPKTIILV